MRKAALKFNIASFHHLRVRGLVVLGVAVCASVLSAQTATFVPTTGAGLSYNTASNWSPATVPNSVGASATFANPTGTESVTTGATVDVVGTINETDGGTFVLGLSSSTGGGFNFSVSSGNAAFNVSGTGTAINTLGAASTLTSTLDATISDTSVTSITGALQINGVLSGAGGFIKDGNGTLSFATAAKTYTGTTVINSGILRASQAGQANSTSGVTVNSGGTLSLAASGTGQIIQFGTSTTVAVTLNGAGTTYLQGNTVNAIGAITTTGSATTLSNNVVLASDSTISPGVALTLSGIVSGSGALTAAGTNTLTLSAANTYTGNTNVTSGTLNVGTASSINASNAVSIAGTGALTLQNAAALADAGSLSMVSGTTLNLNAAAGTSETISSLTLDGNAVAAGTYTVAQLTSLDNAITFGSTNGETLTIAPVPEPATCFAGLLLVGALGWNQRRRLGGLAGWVRQACAA